MQFIQAEVTSQLGLIQAQSSTSEEMAMFLKFRVKAALAKFITVNHLHAETLTLLEAGVIDSFMPDIERRRFDANQGAVMVITGCVVNGIETGGLAQIKQHYPIIFNDLVVLWNFCHQLVGQDTARWGDAFIVGDLPGNPFDYV